MKPHVRALLLWLVAATTTFALAQAPARVTFSASNIQDGSGNAPLPSGALCIMTTDANDIPMGYRVGSAGGQTSASTTAETCLPVTNGVVAPALIVNSAATNPLNACLRITTRDSSSAQIRRDKCVQTGTVAALSTWCQANPDGTIICNWDQYPIGSTPVPLQTVGPTGPQGLQGVPGPVGTVTTGGTNNSFAVTGSLTAGDYDTAALGRLKIWLRGAHGASIYPQQIAMIGDSRMRCWQGTCAVGPATAAQRYPDLFLSNMVSAYGYGGTGLVPLIFNLAQQTKLDTPYTLSPSAFSIDMRLGPSQTIFNPGGSVVVMPSGSTLTVNFGALVYDHLNVYCMSDSASGSLAVAIDGTASGTACGNHSISATAALVRSAAVANSTHTATLTCTGGACYVYGTEGTSGTSGIRLHNMAIGACTSECFNGPSKFAFYDLLVTGDAVYIPLQVIDLLTNDASYNQPAATYSANITAALAHRVPNVSAAYPTASQVGIVPPYFSSATSAEIATLTTKALAAYDGAGAKAVNIQSRWGQSYVAADSVWANPSTDGVHPGTFGTLDEASMLTAATSDVPPPPQTTNRQQINDPQLDFQAPTFHHLRFHQWQPGDGSGLPGTFGVFDFNANQMTLSLSADGTMVCLFTPGYTANYGTCSGALKIWKMTGATSVTDSNAGPYNGTGYQVNGTPGISTSVTAGACTLTVTQGIITAKTGC